MSAEAHQYKKKWRPLERMFHEVPDRYDLLNRIITLGQDERWRKLAAEICMRGNPDAVLDLCTGTGDLALRMAGLSRGSVRIHALDFSEPMLAEARRKAGRQRTGNIEFMHGDAASMPYESNKFDAVGIAFAFRNLTYRNPGMDKFLAEILRVLKNSGKLVLVESSQPANRLYKGLVRVYLKIFVAGLGGLISGHRSAYRYLATSAGNFYDPDEVKHLLLQAGFQKVEYKPFMGGVAGLTVATKK